MWINCRRCQNTAGLRTYPAQTSSCKMDTAGNSPSPGRWVGYALGCGDRGCDNCLSIVAGVTTSCRPTRRTIMVSDTSPRTAVIIGTCCDICDRKASFKNLVELMGGSVPRPCGSFPRHLVGWRECSLSGSLYAGMLFQLSSSFLDRAFRRTIANVNLVSRARLARSDWQITFEPVA